MMKIRMLILIILIYLFGVHFAKAQVSPLCEDLEPLACAPGAHNDGTGESRSESQVSSMIASFAERSKVDLIKQFEQVLSESNQSYFKNVSLAAFGLKDSPLCKLASGQLPASCKKMAAEHLAMLAQKQALGRMLPQLGFGRRVDMQDLAYVFANPGFTNIYDKYLKKTESEFKFKELNSKVELKIFPKIKALMIERIKQLKMSEDKKKLMVSKIESIQFSGNSCGDMAGNGYGYGSSTQSQSILSPNAFYDPLRNAFQICSGYYLQTSSEFQLAFTIGHELAHSIDPCSISYGPAGFRLNYSNNDNMEKLESEFPVTNVIRCLRDEKSVGAKNIAQLESERQKHEEEKERKQAETERGSARRPTEPTAPMPAVANPLAGQTGTSLFCQRDQIGESFSDWVSSEIIPEYMQQNHKLTKEQYQIGYANTLRHGCLESIDNSGAHAHPNLEQRLNRNLLVNPKVRKQMGCPATHSKYIYCNSEKPYVKQAAKAAAKPETAQPASPQIRPATKGVAR